MKQSKRGNFLFYAAALAEEQVTPIEVVAREKKVYGSRMAWTAGRDARQCSKHMASK